MGLSSRWDGYYGIDNIREKVVSNINETGRGTNIP